MKDIRILIGCEESDEVRGRFEALGFDAWSCDLQPNRNPNAKHFQGDIFEILKERWDAFICFPPCTHLASSGAKHFEKKIADGRQQEGIYFFMKMVDAVEKIGCGGIENPVGIMSRIYQKPDQIIQPYYFGDEAQKTTCLWLTKLPKLPKLIHIKQPDLFNDSGTHVGKGEFVTTPSGKTLPKWYSNNTKSKSRSKTFPGIAEAMANQWGNYLLR